MLIYNTLTELIALQLLIVVIIALGSIGVVSYMQKKINIRILAIALALGIIFSFLSLIVAQGNYGGTMYHESFGWPAQFYSITRNIDWSELPSTPVPFNQSFNLIKSLVNVLIYSSVFYLIFIAIEGIKVKKNQVILVSGVALVFTLVTIFGFSIYNKVNTSVEEAPVDKVDSSIDQK